jgi:2-keto-3-deoxy-L-fuconate dehydrogenase
MSDFEGLVAVVTGGAIGIGAATARLLQARGARVAVLERSTEGAPDGVLAVRCDVTDTPAVDAAVAAVVERLDGLDVVLDVNVTGIARVTRAASTVS